MSQAIYELDLHESFSPYPSIIIRRVPGGWIYTISCKSGENHENWEMNSVFVPWHGEFKVG